LTESETPDQKPDEQKPSPLELELKITPDGMQALLSGEVRGDCQAGAVQKAIMGLLTERGTKFGLKVPVVRQAIEQLTAGKPVSKLVVAQGVPPQRGSDAKIKVLAPLANRTIFQVDGKGQLAWGLKDPVPLVQAGAKLVQISPPVPGQEGKGVLGHSVPPPDVLHIRLQSGDGVELDSGRMQATASVEGAFFRSLPDQFQVVEIQEQQCDEDGCGSMEFPGLLRIHGTVQKNAVIRCHTLIAKELQPGAKVIAQGDVFVAGGIRGAEIKAQGMVGGRYMRECTVDCKGDIIVESEVISSRINSEGRLKLTLPEARIVNSDIYAMGGVSCGEVVSSGAVPTVIRFGVSEQFEERFHRLRKQYRDIQKQQKSLRSEVDDLEVELYGTEAELKDMISALKDPERADDIDNLKGQIGMMKPLRESLIQDIKEAQHQIHENFYRLHRIGITLEQMRKAVDPGKVKFVVRMEAAATTEIISPRASLQLQNTTRGFTARERVFVDKGTGEKTPEIELKPLTK
jgi:uncharacterized protein (DUF342 family)